MGGCRGLHDMTNPVERRRALIVLRSTQSETPLEMKQGLVPVSGPPAGMLEATPEPSRGAK